VVGIDMIWNNRIVLSFVNIIIEVFLCIEVWYK
jgi:hypothetical protein